MATSIEERLADLIIAKLQGINPGAGFETTVSPANVTRATQSPAPMEATPPALQLRHTGTPREPILRGANECVATFEVICIAVQDATNEQLADLKADVEKVIGANERWNDGSVNLARRTWLIDGEPHETETGESPATGYVSFAVLFRVDALDAFALKDI